MQTLISTPKKRGGRREGAGKKAFAFTDADRSLVLALRGAGFRHEEIASQIGPKGIGCTALEKHFAHELETGAAKINGICVTGLVKKMQAGDLGALCFWAKTRMGWREKTAVDNRFVDETGRDRPLTLADVDRLLHGE